MKALFSSKKFIAALAGVVAVLVASLLGKAGVAVDDARLTEILAMLAAYILGQGIADHGKGAAEVKGKR